MSLLDSDLRSVDISRPLLNDGPTEFLIESCKVEPNKEGDKENVVVVLKTVHEQEGYIVKADGKRQTTHLNKGFTLTHRMSITPTEKYSEERIMQELKKFRLFVTGDEGGAFAPVEQYNGKTVIGNVITELDKTGQFGPQNRIRNWVKKP